MKKTFVWIILISLVITGCVPNGGASNSQLMQIRAWFDAPLPGTVFYPPNPCQIVAHGASPNGIALFELSVNGRVVSTVPSADIKSSLVTFTKDCGLAVPGEYFLLLRAQDNAGNWSDYAETSLIIASSQEETPAPPPTEPSATEPPATQPPLPTPTNTPTTEPTGSVTVQQVSTDLVYLGRSNCGPTEVTITAQAAAPKGIKVVVLFYRFQASGASSDFQSVGMNPLGGDLYRSVLNPTSLLGGSVPFDDGTLQYQVVVQQSDDDTSLRTQVMADIAVRACGSVSVPTTAACSSFTNERSCIANGCSWVLIPASVPLYECRNP